MDYLSLSIVLVRLMCDNQPSGQKKTNKQTNKQTSKQKQKQINRPATVYIVYFHIAIHH